MSEAVIYFVAGEPSGDAIGGRIISAIRRMAPAITIAGVGGDAMAQCGLTSLFPISDIAVMGLAEVLPHAPTILRRLKQTEADIVQRAPAVVVTIDAPGFCFRLAKRVRKRFGGRIALIHVVAPTVWAWKPKRAAKIAGIYDKLLTLLPFEPPYFEREGLSTEFIGHPVVQSEVDRKSGLRFRRDNRIEPDETVLCILPGSRVDEIKRLLPIFQRVVDKLVEQGRQIHVVIPFVPHLRTRIATAIAGWTTKPLLIDQSEKQSCFSAADAALASSGTVSLELAMAGVPTAIAYRLNPITAAIVRRLVKVKYATLVNLILDRPLVPEFIQGDCTVEKLAPAVAALLDQSEIGDEMRAGFIEALEQLGLGRLDPGKAAAKSILDAVN